MPVSKQRQYDTSDGPPANDCRTPLAGPVPLEQVARTILFLASSRYSASVHGQVVHIDNGRGGALVWQKGESTMRLP